MPSPPQLPALLLHTLGGDRRSWQATLAAAASTRKLITVDLPAHGDRVGESFNLPIAVQVATAAVDRSTGGAYHVVGSGLGAMVALQLRSGARPPMSIVVAGWPVPTEGSAQRLLSTRAAIRDRGMPAFARAYAGDTLVNTRHAHDLIRPLSRIRPEGFLGSLQAALTWNPRTAGPTPVACLVLRGALDSRTIEADSRALASRLSGRFTPMAHAGHIAYLDRPFDFRRMIDDFHARVEAETADRQPDAGEFEFLGPAPAPAGPSL